jgi:BirA family biotin operon repressor/biotin-[acetyl-CoA-carboxylase] ligase
LTDDELVAALDGRGWQSGAEVARRLGLSRAAVWKKVERLREQGYAIEAAAGKGYRLLGMTDRLLPAEVRRHFDPKILLGDIVHHECLDSTNRLAADLARAGAAEGTVVLAEQQTAGRGRLGRTWTSPARVNLYCSVILRPSLPPTAVPVVTLVAAVAVAEAIEDTIATPPAIKWPNDVLLDGRKAVGILTELEAEAERVRFAVLGIGVNVNARRDDFPPDLRRKATSLAVAAGAPVDRVAFTGRLLTRLDRAYERFCREGFAPLREFYERHHCLPGRAVNVAGARRLAGIARGIDDDGALLVECDGRIERVFAGEVTLRGTGS